MRSAEQTANSEHDSLPSPQSFVEARRDAGSQRTLLQLAKIDTTQRIAKADESHRQIQEELRRRADERRTPMLLLDQLVGQTEAAQTEAAADAAAAIEAAELAAAAQQHARDQLAEAQTAVREAHAERHGLPPLDDAIAAQKAEDRASEALTHVRAAVGFATDRHNKASHQVAEQFRELHEAAALPHGAVLPTTDRDLDTQAKAVDTFTRQVEAWQGAAHRVSDLLDRASQDSAFARTAVARADGETRTAVQARNNAVHEAEAVAEIRSLHGAEYEQLHSRRTDLGQKLRAAKQRSVELNSESTTAFGTESEARVQLSSIEPRHKLASEQRDEIVARMRRLIDEGLASITPGTGQESDPGLGRSPSNTADSTRQLPDLAAALAWAKELLADQPKGTVHKQDLETQRSKAEHWLERDVRTASSSLARYDRQVTLHSIEGTNWRRAVVADPESIQGQDLQQAVSSRRDEAAQLERDLREDMKEAMRAGLFTQLYRDINLRRQTAMELVRQIQTTLEGVRTGVAQVGVQVAWRVRDDDDAKQMVDLISRPPSDEVFDQMYTVLRQRMNEMPGESFEKRVAHAFDYRAWHQWDIEITHASFGQTAGKAVFHRVTARTNPLGSLSTGERRLATMLPLLAAAWSMYGGDSSEYTGPRLLMIDEIDAAFDEANLRQILKLLRSWRFDVVATSPSIAPLLKREAQRSVIHELVTTGRHRITIPWLWEGHGQPQLLELQPTLDEAN
ncbi:SbcC/MukB-like Walker B domain-containing protein [Kribbella qitaiheensis]|uniref:SbcC/MukB-like Walker B domain-containing protein n=1 Tax=Kribbella qitaiheensis TaxID=1544730 RepID=UPI0016294C70|nr:SbcC/MukB-like Walker B domain-containing protein [Kribbella qitaiheensis]